MAGLQCSPCGMAERVRVISAVRVLVKSILIKGAIGLVLLAAVWSLGSWYARTTHATDFPVYYNAAQFIFRFGEPLQELFSRPMASLYPLPEIANDGPYNYSPISVVLFSPFIAFDYLTAKTLLFVLSVFAFLGAIKLLLNVLKYPPDDHLFILIPSLFWAPFFDDLRFFQVNALIFAMISVGIWAASRGRDVVGALAFLAATILKLYPILFVLSLWPRHRALLFLTMLLVILAFTVPGTWAWLTGIEHRINPVAQNPLFQNAIFQNRLVYLGFVAGVIAMHYAVLERLQIRNAIDRIALATSLLFLIVKYYQIFNLVVVILPLLVALQALRNRLMRALILSLFSIPIFQEIGEAGTRWSLVSLVGIHGFLLGMLILRARREHQPIAITA